MRRFFFRQNRVCVSSIWVALCSLALYDYEQYGCVQTTFLATDSVLYSPYLALRKATTCHIQTKENKQQTNNKTGMLLHSGELSNGLIKRPDETAGQKTAGESGRSTRKPQRVGATQGPGYAGRWEDEEGNREDKPIQIRWLVFQT